MTISEASVVLGLKVRTIRQWIVSGKLPATKLASNAWDVDSKVIYSEEIQHNANKGREHSCRIKKGTELGMLAGRGENSEKSL